MVIRVILTILSVFTLLSCGACQPKTQNIQDLTYAKPKFPTKSFVQIYSGVNIKCSEGKKDRCRNGWHFFTGSGSVIARDVEGSLVLTAGHVCNASPPENIATTLDTQIAVIDYLSRKWPSVVVHSVHKGALDFCMLYVPHLELPEIPLSPRGLTPGDRVFNISAPGGRYHQPHPLLLEGLFSGNVYGGDSALISIPSIGGVSGSAILNSDMQVVGIVYATNLEFRFETLGTSYNNTLLFLQKALKMYINNKIK